MDLKIATIKKEVDLGQCIDCGESTGYQIQCAAVKGDYMVTASHCHVCNQLFIKTWRNGTYVGTICKPRFHLIDRVLFKHNPKFVVFRSDSRKMSKISWQSIQNDDLADVETLDFTAVDVNLRLSDFILEEDKAIILISEGSLCFASSTGPGNIKELPSRFSAEEQNEVNEEGCDCIIKTSKNKYVVASCCYSTQLNSFIMVDQSCKLFSRVEFNTRLPIMKMTLVGDQILVAAAGEENIHLVQVRRSKLALIHCDLVVEGIAQFIADVKTIGNKSFLLHYYFAQKFVIVKLKV